MLFKIWQTRKLGIALILSCFCLSCNGGLQPPAPVSTIATASLSGHIHFVKPWAPEDSARSLALVLLPQPPPFSVTNLLEYYLIDPSISISLNYLSSDTAFEYLNLKPGTYGYLGVADNPAFGKVLTVFNGDTVYADWQVVGFVHNAQDSAVSFNLHPGDNDTGVNIWVNFDSASRQPFIQ